MAKGEKATHSSTVVKIAPSKFGFYRQVSHDVQTGKEQQYEGAHGGGETINRNKGRLPPAGLGHTLTEKSDDGDEKICSTDMTSPIYALTAEAKSPIIGQKTEELVPFADQFSNDRIKNMSIETIKELFNQQCLLKNCGEKKLKFEVNTNGDGLVAAAEDPLCLKLDQPPSIEILENLTQCQGHAAQGSFGKTQHEPTCTQEPPVESKLPVFKLSSHCTVEPELQNAVPWRTKLQVLTEANTTPADVNSDMLGTISQSCEDELTAEMDMPRLDRKGIVLSVTSHDEGKPFEPEIHKETNQLRQGNPVCPSGNHLAVHRDVNNQQYIKDLGEKQQRERLNSCCTYDGVFHQHGDKTWQKSEFQYQTYLDRHLESVGVIQREENPIGTCFRIGPKSKGYLLTDFHVLSNIFPSKMVPSDANLHFLSHPTVKVWFPGKNRKQRLFNLKPECHFGCPKMDYVVLELEGEHFTQPFQKFSSVVTDQSLQYFLHGYHSNSMELDDTVKILHLNDSDISYATEWCQTTHGYNGYTQDSNGIVHSIKEKEKVPIITRLRHGTSGGPGFHLDDQGKPVVSFMYLRGYPTQYYWLPRSELGRFPSCFLVEQGLRVSEIYSSMNTFKPELAGQLFQFH